MGSDLLYSDKLVEITNDGMLFRNYRFPFGSKRIAFSEVDGIVAKEPTLSNGKWRIQGTSDFRTWFPRDLKKAACSQLILVTTQTQQERSTVNWLAHTSGNLVFPSVGWKNWLCGQR